MSYAPGVTVAVGKEKVNSAEKGVSDLFCSYSPWHSHLAAPPPPALFLVAPCTSLWTSIAQDRWCTQKTVQGDWYMQKLGYVWPPSLSVNSTASDSWRSGKEHRWSPCWLEQVCRNGYCLEYLVRRLKVLISHFAVQLEQWNLCDYNRPTSCFWATTKSVHICTTAVCHSRHPGMRFCKSSYFHLSTLFLTLCRSSKRRRS